ncbi:HD superfamily phosphohydrolase [Peribacillus deserti]|uniref:HD superfamily phosphohydrolase n=1 Tax=Peribacillus deserti TaxID=673318 RepID=A0ABS2QDE6_9BACI|nr:HD domain-containing protein [Peribacillus deserti]MBM7691186.1 HD superfamily phosphohydrolase [Peribacillus deserti]
MAVKDSLYGEFNLEQVFYDLISTEAVQRLKYIHQGGASYLVNPSWNVTRYEHSIGVMLLVRKLGGSVREQIAGLIHDISHTAFSHVIDVVMKNPNQDYHDQIFPDIFYNSEIPDVLLKHGFAPEEILPIDQWPLLEQPLPDLCADRIDYTLRDLLSYKKISAAEKDSFLSELTVMDNRICIKNLKAAEWFAGAYYKEVIDFFLDPLNVFGYAVLSDLITEALTKEILTISDLRKNDEVVWNILSSSKDSVIVSKREQLSKRIVLDVKNYDYHTKKKIRIIDPLVCYKNQLRRGSEVSSKIASLKENALQRSSHGTYIWILD